MNEYDDTPSVDSSLGFEGLADIHDSVVQHLNALSDAGFQLETAAAPFDEEAIDRLTALETTFGEGVSSLDVASGEAEERFLSFQSETLALFSELDGAINDLGANVMDASASVSSSFDELVEVLQGSVGDNQAVVQRIEKEYVQLLSDKISEFVDTLDIRFSQMDSEIKELFQSQFKAKVMESGSQVSDALITTTSEFSKLKCILEDGVDDASKRFLDLLNEETPDIEQYFVNVLHRAVLEQVESSTKSMLCEAKVNASIGTQLTQFTPQIKAAETALAILRALP
ncbi:MAG: hypothetical protein PsegKO_33180 [Pseudohongiellaceae bacterium]